MKISEAIFQADEMRPNAIPMEQKRAWLHAFEAEIAELQEVDTPTWGTGDYDDYDLLLEHPLDYIYPLHLCPLIDWWNQDTQLYQLDAAVANNAESEAKSQYRRANPSTADVQYIKGVFPWAT